MVSLTHAPYLTKTIFEALFLNFFPDSYKGNGKFFLSNSQSHTQGLSAHFRYISSTRNATRAFLANTTADNLTGIPQFPLSKA